MKCQFCLREFTPDSKHPWQKFCSDKCKDRFKKGLFHLRPGYESKSLADWTREARECNLDYGTYRGLRNLGKSYEELKARAEFNHTPAHAHGYTNRPVARTNRTRRSRLICEHEVS